ncbi:MAG TPA: hypothetical protein VGN16_15225 [Acidobacteriaceae bacterium]|jgi:hypothetical protein
MASSSEIELQPKQTELYELIVDHPAPVIGVGGGRGAAKSFAADACAVTLMYERKGLLGCMVMRNSDQILRYHIEAIGRNFPWLEGDLKRSFPAKLRIGRSELDFSYAENLEDIERRFRSGNYDIMFVDQAEQFSGRELRELRKATRSRGGKPAKQVLLFNMRGAGIHDLRRMFHTHEVNKDEDPDDYVFVKFNPWDNVQWVLAPLAERGYSVDDYYAWTDEQRKRFAAEYGPYTRQLATDDEVIRKADWEGDWDSIEGAYFANSFDLESTRITAHKVGELQKSWAAHWISQDYGKSHYRKRHLHSERHELSCGELRFFGNYIGYEHRSCNGGGDRCEPRCVRNRKHQCHATRKQNVGSSRNYRQRYAEHGCVFDSLHGRLRKSQRQSGNQRRRRPYLFQYMGGALGKLRHRGLRDRTKYSGGR